jgi:hypothetical protein
MIEGMKKDLTKLRAEAKQVKDKSIKAQNRFAISIK